MAKHRFWNKLVTNNSHTTVTLRSVEYSVNNTSRIYICGDNGTILKSTTSGSVFGFQNSATNQNLNSIFFYLNDNTGYVCGNNGVILKTTNGGGAIITGINNTGSFPSEYKLEQNYPNPFNPNTTIDFSIPENGLTKLEVIDINGRSVYTMIDQYLNKGNYSASFNGSDIASGIYYYRLTSNNFSKTNKMILLK